MDKLNTYTIEITETLQKQIGVEAENQEDALQQVHEMYEEEKIILDAECLTSLKINCVTPKSTYCKHENLYDTGYGTWVDGKMKNIFRCLDCCKEIYQNTLI